MDTFICGVCSSTFQCFVSLLRHKFKDGHGDLNKCSFCSKTFCQDTDLSHHYQHYHLIDLRLSQVLPTEITSLSTINQGNKTKTDVPLDATATALYDVAVRQNVEDEIDDREPASCQIKEKSICNKSHVGEKLMRTNKASKISTLQLQTNDKGLLKSNMLLPGVKSTSPFKLVRNKESQTNEIIYQPKGSISSVQTLVNSQVFHSYSKPKSYLNVLSEIEKRQKENNGNAFVFDARSKTSVPNTSITNSDHKDFYFLLNFSGDSNEKDKKASDHRYFRCLHCTYSTARQFFLVRHMKKFHNEILDIYSTLDVRNVQELDHDYGYKGSKEPGSSHKVLKMSDYLLSYSKKRVRKRPRKSTQPAAQDRPGQYPCTVCKKVFTRQRFLRRHRVVHSVERPHLCEICGKCYKSREALRIHVCAKSTVKQKVFYRCPRCDFSSRNRKAIHRHRQLHPCGAMLCQVCGEAYVNQTTLKLHARVHDPSKPFACGHPDCTYRFDTDAMRKAHELRHEPPKFDCPSCDSVFRQKHNLKRHIEKFHSKHVKKVSVTSQE